MNPIAYRTRSSAFMRNRRLKSSSRPFCRRVQFPLHSLTTSVGFERFWPPQESPCQQRRLPQGDLGDFAVVYRYDLLFQYSSPNKNDLIETVRLIREHVTARIAALSATPQPPPLQ